MAEEKVIVNDTFKTHGGHNEPPDKKKKKKTDPEDAKIPQSEEDVDGLTYIEE